MSQQFSKFRGSGHLSLCPNAAFANSAVLVLFAIVRGEVCVPNKLVTLLRRPNHLSR